MRVLRRPLARATTGRPRAYRSRSCQARPTAPAGSRPRRETASERAPAGGRLHKRPLGFDVACAFVTEHHHRHHDASRGHKFSLGVITDDGTLVGVAITGRPVARHFDDGLTLEVGAVPGSRRAAAA